MAFISLFSSRPPRDMQELCSGGLLLYCVVVPFSDDRSLY
ncbi:hypothetical protein SOVF_048470 [Spinacia oleracea]|nr:hypothetical protein SOVF_048470 [Spinacia oleracea]